VAPIAIAVGATLPAPGRSSGVTCLPGSIGATSSVPAPTVIAAGAYLGITSVAALVVPLQPGATLAPSVATAVLVAPLQPGVTLALPAATQSLAAPPLRPVLIGATS
jgi:hypothetical protein